MKTSVFKSIVATDRRTVTVSAPALEAAARRAAFLAVWETWSLCPIVRDFFDKNGNYVGFVSSREVGFADQDLEAMGYYVLDELQRSEFEILVAEFEADERQSYSELLTDEMHRELGRRQANLTNHELNALAHSILDHDYAMRRDRIQPFVVAIVESYLSERIEAGSFENQ